MMMSIAESKADEYFFEGAEKLLEIWFDKDVDTDATSLRNIPREKLDKMLEIARCRILHCRSNDRLDSYVLSESSLFISDCRVIMKTCGGTHLLASIPYLLELAKEYAGMETVSNVYYSRKNFLRPHLQPNPHNSFDSEVEFLSRLFPDGEAYCMGPLNTDRWYLFAMSGLQAPPTHVDHTLEILMTDIPSEYLKTYSQMKSVDGRECTMTSGITKLLPFETEVHEELFQPVGYSMNGLVSNTDQYVTIHVTPENEFCFVSFETNQRINCLYKQTLKVLECFKPQKFMMTLFSNDCSHNGKGTQNRLWNEEIPGYRRMSLQFLRLPYDTLVYAQFTKKQNSANVGRLHRVINNVEDDESSHSDS